MSLRLNVYIKPIYYVVYVLKMVLSRLEILCVALECDFDESHTAV